MVSGDSMGPGPYYILESCKERTGSQVAPALLFFLLVLSSDASLSQFGLATLLEETVSPSLPWVGWDLLGKCMKPSMRPKVIDYGRKCG